MEKPSRNFPRIARIKNRAFFRYYLKNDVSDFVYKKNNHLAIKNSNHSI